MTGSTGSHLENGEAQVESAAVEGSNGLEAANLSLPPLWIEQKQHKRSFRAGVIIVLLDICIMPIVYFYSFIYGTTMSLQDIFAIITGLFGLFSSTHYFLRSLKLFQKKKLLIYGPLGWERWGLLEFLNVNINIVVFLVEIELVIGTAPTNPILRLCAMASATASCYLGFLFLASSILTSLGHPLPFNMSSIEKGSPWRPALYAIIEDFVAVEMRGEKVFREQLRRRYDASSMFRRMIAVLSWCWGVGLLITAILTTVLVMVLSENIAFGIGWGLPFLCCALMAIPTVVFVKVSLKSEEKAWRNRVDSEDSSTTEK